MKHGFIVKISNLIFQPFQVDILEESMTSLEDKLSRDFQYLKVNIGCKLPIK